MLVVDEDYEGFGLSGDLAAMALEAGIPFQYAHACTRGPFPRRVIWKMKRFPV